ncbi:MAG: hypothetical protein ACLQVI_03205 [Polyangiaceae bacterium]
MAARSAFRLVHAANAGAPRLARGKPLARPMGAVAIRLPERMSSHLAMVVPQVSPRLFVHEGARQALERKLTSAYPAPVNLSITDNRQSIISHSIEGGVLRVRIHHMFLDAPPSVLDALVRYVTDGDRDASVLVGHYIEANAGRLARRSRQVPLVTKGKRHDLLEILQDVNDRYFDGTVNVLITWGSAKRMRGGRRVNPRRTIKLGSYAAVDRLIRVHPSLDRTWVPRYFVAYIVYHEVLHHVMPATRGSGRRNLHPPEFLSREREFRYFERAIGWEKGHISRLLRS